MAKKEKWVDPRMIDFSLSKWEEQEMTHYICSYNELYIGCAINSHNMTYLDIAKAVLDIQLTKKMYSSRLTKVKSAILGNEIVFYISARRVEVSYALPR